ncbi:MAG: hypothetical protein GVY30_02610 [Chloroflexi bacterium]|nr:hypothetical protein [Chloroflexota bacterium]
MRRCMCVFVLCLTLTACLPTTSPLETPTLGVSSVSTPSVIATPQAPTLPPATSTATSVPTSVPTLTPTAFAPVEVAEVYAGDQHDDGHNVELSYVETVGGATDVAVAGPYAYVADGDVGLQGIDISAIYQAATLSFSGRSGREVPGLAVMVDSRYVDRASYRPPLGKREMAYRLAVRDDLAYVAGGRFQIVDVSDPLAPQVLSLQDFGAFDVAVAGTYAYVAAGSMGDVGAEDIQVMDVSNPTAPKVVSRYEMDDEEHGPIAGIAIGGDYLYIAALSSDVYVVDVSDPLAPTQVSIYPVPLMAWDVELFEDRAFVVWNLRYTAGGPSRECESGVSMLDVSTPETPVEIGQYCDPGRSRGVTDVAVSDPYMYVAAGERGLRILDISDPTAPEEVGFYETSGDFYSVTVEGDYIYVADASGGLFIFRFAPD